MKILIVDDSAVQRKIIIRAIRDGGVTHEVLEAGDGKEAIKQLGGGNYKDIGLILCDWNMPNITGIEFIEGLAKIPLVSKIPVFMVTSEGSFDKIIEARNKHPGLAGYIVKPFNVDDLMKKITPYIYKE